MNPKSENHKKQLIFKIPFIAEISNIITKNHYIVIKSPYCHHKQGCVINVLSGALKSFCIAYGVKTSFEIIFLLMGMKKRKLTFSKFLEVFKEQDTLRFAGFPALYAMIQKSILCYFRNNTDQDKRKYSFISGFAAGYLSLGILKPGKRSIWALYLATRSMETILNSLQNRGVVKKRQYYYILLMMIATCVTGYAYGMEGDQLESYMVKFYSRFAHETKAEVQFRHVWHMKKKLDLGY